MALRAALMGCVVLLGALTASALAASGVPTRVQGSKHADGPYSSDTIVLNVAERPKSVYFKLTNRTNHVQDLLLQDDSFGAGLADFRIRWFRGDEEVTEEAQGIGTAFRLKPRRPKIVRARVKALEAEPDAFCLNFDLSVAPDEFITGGTANVNSSGACG